MVLERIPILGIERVALAHCVGRVLAEDLIATESLPAFPASAVDGYAVRSADAGKPLRVVGVGGPGPAVRVLTGGVFPDGADCVVMVEDGRLEGEVVTTPGSLQSGSNFHRPGADVRAGERAPTAGSQLGGAAQGVGAARGCL